MKRLRKSILALVIIGLGFMSTSCFGSFQLTRNFYQWHDSTIENKFLKTLLFYIPFGFVYGITAMVDFFVLNLIEFWGGSNPVAMAEDDYEVEYHTYSGVSYKIEATQNLFTVTQLDGEAKGTITKMRFDDETQTWFYEQGDDSVALMTISGEDNENLAVYSPNGEIVKFDLNQDYSQEEILDEYREVVKFSTTASKEL